MIVSIYTKQSKYFFMNNFVFLYKQDTLTDDDGFYQKITWLWNPENKRIHSKIEDCNSFHNRYEKLVWTRELSEDETKKFLDENIVYDGVREKIEQIIRDLKISDIIS